MDVYGLNNKTVSSATARATFALTVHFRAG